MTLFNPSSNLSSQEHARAWAQPPTLTFTLSESDSDPSISAVPKPAAEYVHDSSADPQGATKTGADDTPGPRGHHLALTIPSRLVKPPSIPALSQISLSLSSLPPSRSSRSKSNPSTSSTPAPALPTSPSFSAPKPDQQEEHTKSKLPFRAPVIDSTTNYNSSSGNTSTKGNSNGIRIRANTITAIPSPPPLPRLLAFASTAAFFTSMSRPSWDPFPLINTVSSHSHTHALTQGHANAPAISASSSTSSPPTSSISNPNPISSEDARLLDPSYLSSTPLSCQTGHHGSGGAAHTHVIPYIDPQGTLHDPDYRPFPLIRHTKQPIPSPFAIRKPYWECEEDDREAEFGDSYGEDGYDTDGSMPNTPTSTTPFICYFLETHPLKRGTALRAGPSSHTCSSDTGGSGRCGRGRGKGAHGHGGAVTRPQLKLGATYMYATFSTGVGNRNPSYPHSPITPTGTTAGLPVPQYTTTLSASPPRTDDVSMGKEKRGWGGLLWKSGRKEGGEKD